MKEINYVSKVQKCIDTNPVIEGREEHINKLKECLSRFIKEPVLEKRMKTYEEIRDILIKTCNLIDKERIHT